MPTNRPGYRDLPRCYGTRDAECANRGCLWERGCAAETWVEPREMVCGARRKVTNVFSSPFTRGNGCGEKWHKFD